MNSPVMLHCPHHSVPLEFRISDEKYFCPSGCSFPIIENIPRFVPTENYASSFGLQWNEFRLTQVDSFTGLTISRDRLTRLLGGNLDIVKDKKVLEAGCGAGRFTEILLASGAHVYAVDLSIAVEANFKNCHTYSGYFVYQADILNLPFEAEQFDIVVCIGVLQGTPNPEEAMAALCAQVAHGGMLVIDHYSRAYPITLSRRMLRTFLLRMPKTFSLKFCKFLTSVLWPLHKILWKYGKYHAVRALRYIFLKLSPVVDYHDAYPQLGPKLLKIWGTLDMHDTMTDYYKHLRNAEEIKNHLQRCGMTSIETRYAGNGVEARARKPF